ncbi:cytochrome P450 [Talaromyces proteolyticus]|uniref:Cytochrome P450 n=1 Tax=Talaromyces proteolyticus TaxID=1131652 RepID=A0AAD4KRB4_9EURO|nr:cytochrome P450 [Talaromyces proteolyticus]KAH8694304.1 cytochrome P450 [Talaromyces proteolyticus]
MTTFAAICLWVIFFTVSWIVYTYLFSPLASIPNAGVLSPISRLLWEFPMEYRGRISLVLPELHKKHGPLVRIGPNQVSFYSLEAYKAIHSPTSLFVKDPRVYNHFVQDGHPALFSIIDPKKHALRRRKMGILFNRSKVPSQTPMMLEKISEFCTVLHHLGQKGPINLISSCRALEADILTARFAFGNEIGAIESLRQSGDLLSVVHNNDLKSSMMPIWADKQLQPLVNKEMAAGCNHSFMSTMVKFQMPPQSALSEAKEMLGPGTDTTSSTLAHILWALSVLQSFQKELVLDLTKAGWPTELDQLEAIPKLKACVKEGIRWTGAAAAMLPRIVPSGGSIVAGKKIPGGTMVCSSPIWYLRDENAFSDPDTYRPSRWLDDTSGQSTAQRDDYYIPFSKGSSTCIGIHFSYLELYLSLIQILKNFVLKPSCHTSTDIDIEPILPPRLEWVAAVPKLKMEIHMESRVY